MNLRKTIVLASAVSAIGCSDSETIDTLLTPTYFEPVEAFVIQGDDVHVIEVINEDLPTPRSAIETSVLLRAPQYLTLLDTDLSSDRDNETYIEDRGMMPELLVYTKASDTDQIFLMNLASRREHSIYDLGDTLRNETGDNIICSISPANYADLQRLTDDRFEVKQEQKVRFTTAETDCSIEEEIRYFMLDISIDEEVSYNILQPVLQDSDDPNAPKYNTEKVEYNGYTGRRHEIDQAFFESPKLVVNTAAGDYAFLSYFDADNGALNSTFELHTPIEYDNVDTYRLWSESINHASADTLGQNIDVLNNFNIEEDPFVFIRGNGLYRITQSSTFDLVQSSSRSNSLETAIYTWTDTDSATREKINILESGSIALIDGDDVKIIEFDDDNNATTRTLRSLDSSLQSTKLVSSPDLILVQKTNSSDIQSLALVDISSGVESPVISQIDALFTYDNQVYFDYHQEDIDSGADRHAAIQSNGSITDTYVNSGWMSLENYLADDTEQYILVTEDSTGGLLRTPEIYAYNEAETTGQGALKGTFPEGLTIASITKAVAFSERFGMVWIKSSFASDAPDEAFYFVPSAGEWVFSPVSELNQIPDWLPYLAP